MENNNFVMCLWASAYSGRVSGLVCRQRRTTAVNTFGYFWCQKYQEGGLLNDGFTSALNFLGFGGNGTVPEGVYLNYLVFSSNFTFMNGGFSALGSSTSYVKRAIGDITFPEDGYLIAYVSFEKSNNHRAHFDDFLVTHRRSTVMQEQDYYPFGGSFNSYTRSYSTPNKFKYNGKELQEETQLYDYGARFYDPWIGRFSTQDRFAEKYLDLNPYQYAANNPIFYIDVNGDSLNFSSAQSTDPALVKKTQNDLQDATGLSLSIDSKTGQMTYATETIKKGKQVAKVATDADGKKVGSKTARNKLMKAIGHEETVQVYASTKVNSMGGGLQMNLNDKQISDFISGTSSDLDSKTMGYGMTFLHELTHTDIGGKLGQNESSLTTFGTTSSTVSFMNKVRKQLNNQGGNYGQRMSYSKLQLSNGLFYIPFSSGSLNDINRGLVPATKHVETK